MNETVHIANVVNFIKIFKKIRNLKLYNPIASKLKVDSLEELKEELKQTLKEVKRAEKLLISTREKRNELYYEIHNRAVMISLYLTELAQNEEHLSGIKDALLKITGKCVHDVSHKDVAALNVISRKGKTSVSQKLYEIRKKQFYHLILVLSKTAEYSPDNKEIQLKSLNNLKKLIQINNRNLRKREEVLEKTKQYRDLLLYHENIGATAIAKRIKQYVYEVYKPASKEYKRVQAISFKKADGFQRTTT